MSLNLHTVYCMLTELAFESLHLVLKMPVLNSANFCTSTKIIYTGTVFYGKCVIICANGSDALYAMIITELYKTQNVKSCKS